ncbi:L-lactate dehydrogenase [Neodiprion pinetum]|uniref:L-lactate dehydrogenase n=2 Tax=Neodiprion TaxID=270857 RepID=A0A6J0CAP4_NEOLC|nr:L-lactate dehydrogenase-like [Neodiprion lecontei]XP_046466731.1 L-lactate dehydrogenase-like [Neodiprion pinetum]
MLRHLVLRVVKAPSQPRRCLVTARRLCARNPPLIRDAFASPNAVNNPEKIITPGNYRLTNCGPPPCLRDELLCNISEPIRDSSNKVTVVGAGMCGIAAINAILCQKITGHVAIVDAFPKRMEGEALDLQHGATFMGDPRIEYDTDFCASSNSKVVILTAGARQLEDESRLDLLQRNVEIFKNIIPPLVQYSPDAIFLVVTNPVDIMTWVTWKLSNLPVHKVIGTGTQIDSSRFQFLISERLGISPSSIAAWIIGEHGDSQVPLWSGVNVAGVQLRDIVPNIGLATDYEKWNEVHQEVIRAGMTLRCLKGYTNTAIGLCVAGIVDSILRNVNDVKSISTLVQGHHNICDEIFLSLPVALGEGGITKIIRMRMTEFEKKQLMLSAETIAKAQKDVKV